MASCRFPGFRSIFHPSVQNLPTLQRVSIWDDKNIPPSLTQWAYQSSTHRLIDEVNYQFARRISDVASTPSGSRAYGGPASANTTVEDPWDRLRTIAYAIS